MGRKKKDRTYFGEEQEIAVRAFIASGDMAERERIFENHLKRPLIKMIESIIRTYKLYRANETFDDLLNDTFSFVMTKIEKFKPSQGTKAYSYMGTICKNYLLAQLLKSNRDSNVTISYEDYMSEIVEDPKYSYIQSETELDYRKLIDNIKEKITEVITRGNINDNEKRVGDSLVYIFENWENIFDNEIKNKKFNKNLILLIIRERTRLTTKEIRQNMKKFKKHYLGIKMTMLDF